jgi:hypothetical protein
MMLIAGAIGGVMNQLTGEELPAAEVGADGGAVLASEAVIDAAVSRALRKQTVASAVNASARIESYWRAEKLRETGGRVWRFFDSFWEIDAQLLAAATAVFLLTALLAYLAPQITSFGLRVARVPERYSRGIWLTVFSFVVGLGFATMLAVFQVALWRSATELGLFALVFSYGLGVEISNIASGLLLPFHSAIEVGKELTVAEGGDKKTGVIDAIGLRYTSMVRKREDGKRVRTWIPNHVFTGQLHDELLDDEPLPPPAPPLPRREFTFDAKIE